MNKDIFIDKVFSANARQASPALMALAEWLTVGQLVALQEKE